MRILHYSLGFPPYRTGGMTKFSMDLMVQQHTDGHDIGLLWPGRMLGGKTYIRKHKPAQAIESYEIVNPLPVPYDEGIADVDAFVQDGPQDVFCAFLREVRPDVLHVHTLMGLHAALLAAAKERGVRTVFTTHDFFPLCPKVTLYRQGKVCDSVLSCAACAECNSTALSLCKIRLLQSGPYRVLKDTPLVRGLRKRHRDGYFDEATDRDMSRLAKDAAANEHAEDYLRLRAHYGAMLQSMDSIHYNSSVTRDVYARVFDLGAFATIPLSHANIADRRKRRDYAHGTLRIRYLGPQRGAKGYFLLRDALDTLWREHQDFCLDVHFTPTEPSAYMRVHGRYAYHDLPQIFDETDVLVAPSVWYETFGYTVLEALSFGVPVVVSGTVGAKDILTPGAGVVIQDMSAGRLADTLRSLTPDALGRMNERILEGQRIMTLPEMSARIATECYAEK